jgi:MFS family permease
VGRSRPGSFFGVERNVAAVSAAMFLVGLGESLWTKFMPRYLQALGAPAYAIGAYGSARDLLDGLYQYPGGWLGDRLGRQRALIAFIILAIAGYISYLVAPSWQIAILGLVFVMGWTSMASPTLFAVVGDALPPGRRAIGFTVQSLLKRVPLVIGPVVGGIVISRMGVAPGMRWLLAVTVVFATAAIAASRVVNLPRVADAQPTNVMTVWRSFPGGLRTLLVADVFARICEGLVDVFLVIYATVIVGVTPGQFGVLVAVQSLTSMLVYLPAARISDAGYIKPVVIATFLAFALFPLAVVSAHSFGTLVLAFIVGGLREFGEPSRKSMIVDFAAPSMRARTVGLYYLLRSVTIAPSAMIGAALWARNPAMPFYAAFAVGMVGAVVFSGVRRL